MATWVHLYNSKTKKKLRGILMATAILNLFSKSFFFQKRRLAEIRRKSKKKVPIKMGHLGRIVIVKFIVGKMENHRY
jgi:hypothetical protein